MWRHGGRYGWSGRLLAVSASLLALTMVALLLAMVPARAAPCGAEPPFTGSMMQRQALIDSARRLAVRDRGLETGARQALARLTRGVAPGKRAAYRRFFLHALCKALIARAGRDPAERRHALARLARLRDALARPVPVRAKRKAAQRKKFAYRPMTIAPGPEALEAEAPQSEAPQPKAMARPAKPSPAGPTGAVSASRAPTGRASPSAPPAVAPMAVPPAGTVSESRGRPSVAPPAAAPSPRAPVASFGAPSAFAPPASQARSAARSGEDCTRLGDLPRGQCASYEEVIANLRDAPLAYNHPDSMYYNRRTEVSLVLGTDGGDPGKALEGAPGKVVRGKTKISRFMAAELKGVDFKIEPEGRQEQLILMGRKTKWTWFVTPLRPGPNKPLILELYAQLREGETILPPVSIRTF